MAVLYRSNAQSRVIEEALLRANIAYQIYGGQRFFERAEIKNALAYMRLIEDRHSDPAFERVVNTPPRGIGDKSIESIRQLARQRQQSMWTAAKAGISEGLFAARVQKTVGAFIQLMDDLAEAVAPMTLEELAEHVIEVSGLMAFHSQERGELVEDLMAPLGTILAAMLATILLTFNSWRLTGIAFGVTGCSFGLSLLALAIFQYPLGIQALIGVIGSVGVSINAAIIILSGLKLNEGATAGEPDAIVDVVMDASRHIVSTTVTTFGGFLPLILEGSEFWPPFAMAIAGGVLLSTIVSFYLVPPLYTLLMHPRRHFLQHRSEEAVPKPPVALREVA